MRCGDGKTPSCGFYSNSVRIVMVFSLPQQGVAQEVLNTPNLHLNHRARYYEDVEKRHSIADVSEKTGVPVHVLRQWEKRFPQLKPQRDRSNRRYYTAADIAIVRRIKELLRTERMTSAGARLTLGRELRGEGRPRTRHESQELIRRIESGLRDLIVLLDSE